MERPRYYAKFVLDEQSITKTPKYVLVKSAGEYAPMKELIGSDGYISMYLRTTPRTAKKATPSINLQAKASLNFTGLKYFGGGVTPGCAYGYPFSNITYSKARKKNPFYNYRFDGYLFMLKYDCGILPTEFELLVIEDSYSVISLRYQQLCKGEYNDCFQRFRDMATDWEKREK